MRFRTHRGGLAESLLTICFVNSSVDLIERVNKEQEDLPHQILYDVKGKIKYKYCGYDIRTGWDTYYVMILDPDGEWDIVGMSDNNAL